MSNGSLPKAFSFALRIALRPSFMKKRSRFSLNWNAQPGFDAPVIKTLAHLINMGCSRLAYPVLLTS
jgi:hypothetical protein